VVAHEIGHAILLTTRHAAHGLMQPRIDGADLRPLDDQFALSAADRQRLAVRFSNLPQPGPVVLAAFTWTEAPPVPSLPRAPR
jgi:hypothetical protein